MTVGDRGRSRNHGDAPRRGWGGGLRVGSRADVGLALERDKHGISWNGINTPPGDTGTLTSV